ncbi:MAG: glycosyltransferase family 2 protein [Thaumarchaeota archaeon]|nr:glycosyltransferase family 2 protein [Nitrososphaerota archaeon]
MKVALIPAFNEERVIFDVIKKCQKYVDKVIVYDDGSTDDTMKISQEAGAEVIRYEKNLGKGAALRTLFQHARKLKADIAVTIDGDGQFMPEEIPKLLVPILEKGYDIVIGYRFEDNEMPSYRKIGNKVLDKITNIASELPFRDTQSGFRSYSKKAIEVINIKTEGFGVDAEILIDASQKGLKITEEKITVLYNTGSKTSTKNPISHTFEVVSSLVEIIAIKHPLRYLGIPGISLMIIGIVFAIDVISVFNVTRYFSIPSTLVAMGAVLIGLMLLLMSVVLYSIGKTVRKRDWRD